MISENIEKLLRSKSLEDTKIGLVLLISLYPNSYIEILRDFLITNNVSNLWLIYDCPHYWEGCSLFDNFGSWRKVSSHLIQKL